MVGMSDPSDSIEKPDAEKTPAHKRSADGTPFDNPWFLPGLLTLLAVWFGYDGWFNPEIEAVMFNRVGFGIWVALALYTGLGALRETRAKRDG